MGQHLVDHRMVIAGVVARAAGDQIGELVGANEIAAPQFDAVQPQRLRHEIDACLDGVVGRRLAKAPHRLLHRLVGGDGDGLITHAVDLVGPHNGADGLAQLERRAARIGSDIVEGAHFHGVDDAIPSEGQLHVEDAVGPMHVAAAHVLQPILDQAHRTVEQARQMGDEHGVLDAALDAIAAAHIHILMHAHAGHGQAQGARDLVREFRHLDRGPDVHHIPPGVPRGQHREGLDGHGGVAAPHDPVFQLMFAACKILFHRAPVEGLVEQHIRAMARMYRLTPGIIGLLGADHEGQGLVGDFDELGRILSDGAGVRHHGGDPFAHVAGGAHRQRIALHRRGLQPVHQGLAALGEFRPRQDLVDARQGQRGGRVDGDDPGGRMGRGHQRHMQHAFGGDVAGVMALADHEAPVLDDAAGFGDVAERSWRAHSDPSGVFEPASRWAASWMASTICP